MIKKIALNTVMACAAALVIATPQNIQAAALTLDDFNVNEGHFTSNPNGGSGSSSNIGTTSTADRVTTDSPREGTGQQKLVLNPTTPDAFARLRHLSGAGSAANNTAFTTSAGVDGWIGVYVKTTNAGWTVQIWLEGASNNGSIEKTVIEDGQWHLYEWDLDNTAGDADGWGNIAGIIGGTATVANGSHTIDSIIFRNAAAPASSTIFMDFVAKSASGSVETLLQDPCINTSGVLVGGPLSTNSNQVSVIGVSATATAVKVYQKTASGTANIGTLTNGIVAGNNLVTVTGLVKNAEIIATQTVNNQESCQPNSGIFVGGGANPPVRLALNIRETTDTGPVGASATDVSSGNIHFLGASTLTGGAPVNAPIIYPSNVWQTVTFSRGTLETVGDVSNPLGTPVDGTGYLADDTVSLQIYAYRTLTNGVRIYSANLADTGTISSNGTFNAQWTWSAVPGANGYRLLRNTNSFGYLDHHDVTVNSYTDNNTGWTAGVVVTPNTARSNPSVKWNTSTGDPAPIGTQNNIVGDWGILEGLAFSINSDTGPFDFYIDNIQNGSTVFRTFETVPAGTLDYGFRQPSFSGTTSSGLLAAPNTGVVTNIVADTGTNAFRVQFQWNGTNTSKWLRLTTSGAGAGTAANPLVNLDDPISVRLLLLPVGSVPPSLNPVSITYSLSGNQLTLNWTGTYDLESKTDLNDASWTPVGVSSGPYVTTVTGPAKFYRLHKP